MVESESPLSSTSAGTTRRSVPELLVASNRDLPKAVDRPPSPKEQRDWAEPLLAAQPIYAFRALGVALHFDRGSPDGIGEHDGRDRIRGSSTLKLARHLCESMGPLLGVPNNSQRDVVGAPDLRSIV